MFLDGSADQKQSDDPFRCMASLSWGDSVAEFTYVYRLETMTFTDVEAKRKTLEGGMQSICSVTVRVWQISWSKDMGEWGAERREVKDD